MLQRRRNDDRCSKCAQLRVALGRASHLHSQSEVCKRMWHMHTFVVRFALTSMASASGPALKALVHVMPRSKGLLASQALYCSATACAGPEVGGGAAGRRVVWGCRTDASVG